MGSLYNSETPVHSDQSAYEKCDFEFQNLSCGEGGVRVTAKTFIVATRGERATNLLKHSSYIMNNIF